MGRRGDKGKSKLVEMGVESRTLKGLVLGKTRDILSFVTGGRKAERVAIFEGRR